MEPRFPQLTIAESAVRVLEKSDAAMHHTEIAREALRRGYGHGRIIDEEKVMDSFSQILRRDANGLFEKMGEGKYRLRKPKT